jgi:NAD(P)-dependent dehydrogenase (short-subunit alcohol dehydrogenase family)
MFDIILLFAKCALRWDGWNADCWENQEPDIDDSLDVNLRGPILFSRIASVYLRQQPQNEQSSSSTTTEKAATKSLTLVSSVAGFTEAPGLAVYSAGKHGVYGLMRALRK